MRENKALYIAVTTCKNMDYALAAFLRMYSVDGYRLRDKSRDYSKPTWSVNYEIPVN